MAPKKQDRYRTIRDLASAIADVSAPRSATDGGSTAHLTSNDSILAPVSSGGSQAGPRGPTPQATHSQSTGPATHSQSTGGSQSTGSATHSQSTGPATHSQSTGGRVDTETNADQTGSQPPDSVGELGDVGFPPCKPPVEIFPTDEGYLVREFRTDPSNATVFSTHDKRIAAMRAAANKLTEAHHPCTLRWDTPNSVGELYWNDRFESLQVEYSELFDAWVVISKENAYTFSSAPSAKWAYKDGKRIQQAYDFKELKICSRQGNCKKTVEHRFIRHSLTKPGITFNR
jgi:hypothetical protein